MPKLSPQMHVLTRALRERGGEAALAKALGVPAETLTRWLSGHEAIPPAVYFKTLGLSKGR